MKKVLSLMVVLVMVFALAACGGDTSSSTPSSAPVTSSSTAPSTSEPAGDTLKVAVVLQGLISDAGWNTGGYLGAEYLNKSMEGVEATYIENVSATNADATFRDYADQGYDLIVGWSVDFGDYILAVAEDYPDTKFIWAQGWAPTENVAVMSAALQETAYLCGIIAAEMSETGVIGYIGGQDTNPQINALEGYREGAESVNPDIKVIATWAGTWSDVEKGKETAIAQFEQGVDVMMGRGDGVANGVRQACEENDVWCFGDVADQNELLPDLLLTSTVWNVGKNFEYIIEDIRAGSFGASAPNEGRYKYGMADGVTDIADFHGLVPDDIAAKVMEVRDQIINGELVIEPKNEQRAD